MIVRNEESTIIDSINSLIGLAEEIVVYDTGSTDQTTNIISNLSNAYPGLIRLIHGYWDDDFSRARNESLNQCSNDWVFIIDADETIDRLDKDSLSLTLDAIASSKTGSIADVDAVQIEVVDGAQGVGRSQRRWKGLRLIRKSRCQWAGRIHEQIRKKLSNAEVDFIFTDSIVLRHHSENFTQSQIQAKKERNLRIAAQAVKEIESSPFPSHVYISLGRTYLDQANFSDAIDSFQQGLLEPSISPIEQRMAYEGIIRSAIAIDKFALAEESLKLLGDISTSPVLAAYLDALVKNAKGKYFNSRTEFERSNHILKQTNFQQPDDFGSIWDISIAAQLAIDNYIHLEDFRSAIELILSQLSLGRSIYPLQQSLDIARQANVALSIIANVVPHWNLKNILAEITTMDITVADELLELLYARWPDEPATVVVASMMLGDRMEPARSRLWSSRLEALKNEFG